MTASTCLVVFARAPVAGQVKTRLFRPSTATASLRPITADEAATLHRAFIADVCEGGARSGIERRLLYVAGDPFRADPYLKEVGARHGYELRVQGEGDLGQRMDAAITYELSRGAAGVVLVGTDSPTASPEWLAQAAAALLAGQADVVLGPATDGGYWLVGARRPCPALFAPGIAWGGPAVLSDTLGRLHQLQVEGLRVHLLPFFYDVDTPEDLRLLIGHLRLLGAGVAPETRAALQRMGLLS